MAELHTKDREYSEKFVELYDKGYTNFENNKQVFVNKCMDLQLVINLLADDGEDGLQYLRYHPKEE